MTSLWRASVFGLQGLRDYTHAGYERHARSFTPADLDIPLTAQVAVVSGANSGIGYEVVRALWLRGATVYMLCRDRERGKAARQRILDEKAGEEDAAGRLKLEVVDVSRPQEISAFATRVFGHDGFLDPDTSTASARLDVLVNNAGVLLNTRQVTPDGIEASFATNVLGTVHLTLALLPALRATAHAHPDAAPPRVVTVSSGGAYNARLSTDDLESSQVGKYDGNLAYAMHKRGQVELTQRWAREYPDVHFSVMHPGWASTPGVDRSLPGFARTMEGRLRTAAEGADTVVWLTVKARGESGGFWFDRAEARRHLWGARTEVSESEVDRLERACRGYLQRVLKPDTASTNS